MTTQSRTGIVDHKTEGVFHCISHCVRRAFLCGKDPYTGRDYEHRKQWINLRLTELAEVFFVDVCDHAITNTQLHVILRIRPDRSAAVSDEEIARRWRGVYSGRRPAGFAPTEPSREELDRILTGNVPIAELRSRLSSISWFLRRLKEDIARRANVEDECTGRFWETRSKCIPILDQTSIPAFSAHGGPESHPRRRRRSSGEVSLPLEPGQGHRGPGPYPTEGN